MDEHLALARRARPTDDQDPPRDWIAAYIHPHLPGGEECPLTQISRRHLHDIQGALLEHGLAKTTIDGAISSLSAVLGYALREHRIEVNPALGARVDPADTRLQPTRVRVERGWVPPAEAGRLLVSMDAVEGWPSRVASVAG